MAGVCNKWWCDGRIWRLAKNLKMKIDEQVLRLMVLCPVSPVSTQQYPLLNKNHFGKILYQIFSNLVSNSSRGLQSKNTELFLSNLKLCRARAATGLAYLLRKLRSICVWVLNNILKIIMEDHDKNREKTKTYFISIPLDVWSLIKIQMFLKNLFLKTGDDNSFIETGGGGGGWLVVLTLILLLRLGSWGEDWQEHFIRQRKQFYEGAAGWCWQPDILMSHSSHSPTRENRRTAGRILTGNPSVCVKMV